MDRRGDDLDNETFEVRMKFARLGTWMILISATIAASHAADPPPGTWKVGEPIVNYWAGPGSPGGAALDDAAATQLVEGGWNLVWCAAKDLPVVARRELRGLLTDPLLDPKTLDDPESRGKLEALVDRVRVQPGFYAYYLTDEPSAAAFPALGRLVAFLRDRDPAHLAYINILPTYANNQQLGTEGTTVPAYAEHLRQYVATVRPSLISYDHYQFTRSGDQPNYFLNLAMVRQQAITAGVPFMNIVQASSWVPTAAASPTSPRVPNADELRYLVYTTLAYGAQGVGYYVYGFPEHEGGMVRPDGKLTPLYQAARTLNREFAAIARELQPNRSLGAWHAGMRPPGVEALPERSAFKLDPSPPTREYQPGQRVTGILIGQFGPPDGEQPKATHALVVNLDYQGEQTITLTGPGQLEVFDPALRRWSPTTDHRIELRLAKGGGKLIRVQP